MQICTAMQDDELLSTKAVAELLGVSVGTINRWAKEKTRIAPVTKMGVNTGAYLWRRSDIVEYIARQAPEAAS